MILEKGFKSLLKGFKRTKPEMQKNIKKCQKSSTNIHVHTSCTSIIPNSLLIMQNWSLLKGLVKILASWLWVSTNSMQMSSLSAWFLMKWGLISICFVRECWTGFLVILMALLLSQKIGTLCIATPKCHTPNPGCDGPEANIHLCLRNLVVLVTY